MEKFTGKPFDLCRILMNPEVDPNSIWDLCTHKEKRNLSQNCYYWVLLEKLTVKTHIPKAKLHNINLRHLGLVERVGDKPVYILLPDTDKVENETLLATTYHLAPRKETKVGDDGITYRWYVMLRGSSDLNVQEMSVLVDFAVQDAKANGIEVLPPSELERMRELERQHEAQKNQGNGHTTKSQKSS